MAELTTLAEADTGFLRGGDTCLRGILYDAPESMLSMPPNPTATCGRNSPAYAVEVLYTTDVSPIAALLAEEPIRVIARAPPMCASGRLLDP